MARYDEKVVNPLIDDFRKYMFATSEGLVELDYEAHLTLAIVELENMPLHKDLP